MGMKMYCSAGTKCHRYIGNNAEAEIQALSWVVFINKT